MGHGQHLNLKWIWIMGGCVHTLLPCQRYVSFALNHQCPLWWLQFRDGSATVDTLRPNKKGRHFTDDTFKCISLNENVTIAVKIPLKFVPKGQINNIPALVFIMAWRLPGDKPLSEPMVVKLPTHICAALPQWVKPRCHVHNGSQKSQNIQRLEPTESDNMLGLVLHFDGLR